MKKRGRARLKLVEVCEVEQRLRRLVRVAHRLEHLKPARVRVARLAVPPADVQRASEVEDGRGVLHDGGREAVLLSRLVELDDLGGSEGGGEGTRA